MFAFFKEATSPFTLPFTILLALVILYWLIVILGAVDADWMPDMDLEADDSGGILAPLFQLLNIGDVPITLVISTVIFISWCFSMLSGHFLNPGGIFWMGMGLLAASAVLGLFTTAIFTRLMIRAFGPLGSEDQEDQQVLYRVGTVITSQVNSDFGQVEIETAGAPITIHARTVDGKVFMKGDKVLVFDENEEKGLFFVDKYDE